MKTIAFFNNKGGVGKTSLVYHLAWMYALQGFKVIAADFDPQANLTSMFLDEDRLEQLWPETAHTLTIMGAVQPLLKGIGDVQKPHIESVKAFEGVSDNLGLIAGDLGLSSFEDPLSSQWPLCSDGDERAFRVISAFYRIIEQAAQDRQADLVLIDVGPNLGAINRAAIIASDFVIIPLAPDLFSLQGLRNLGPTLRRWRKEWRERLTKNPEPSLSLPTGKLQPAGYIILQQPMRMDRPVKAFGRWMAKIPSEYAKSVLNETDNGLIDVQEDINRLATLKNYRSLMPLAMEAGKPMFLLRTADGAIGSHYQAVQECYKDFEKLAKQVLERIDTFVPQKI